jgi:chromosome segregation ATPase
MKHTIIAVFTLLSVFVFGQNEVRINEEHTTFSVGSKNSIVVNIPFANLDILEKELKRELKDWGGKYNSSKDEYTSTQASFKAMGDKPFDVIAKIIKSGETVKVAFAIDLGGAYLTSNQHQEQFNVMKDKIKAFAISASKECVAEELKTEGKVLSSLEKDQKELEKDKESLLNSIEDYRKKIAEAEKKIEENVSNQSKKKAEIAKQAEKLKEVEKKKNIH